MPRLYTSSVKILTMNSAIAYWALAAGALKFCKLLQFELTTKENISQIFSARLYKASDAGNTPAGTATKNGAGATNINQMDPGDTNFNGNVYYGPWGVADPTEVEYIAADYQNSIGGWAYAGPPIPIPPAAVIAFRFNDAPTSFTGNILAVISEEG